MGFEILILPQIYFHFSCYFYYSSVLVISFIFLHELDFLTEGYEIEH
jgi:hypothetical protein